MPEGLATGPVHILLEVPPAVLTPARVKVKGVKVTLSGRKVGSGVRATAILVKPELY